MANSESKNDNQIQKGGLSTTHIILIVGFTILIAIAGVALYFFLHKDEPQLPPDDGLSIVDENNADTIGGLIQGIVDDNMFQTYMNTEWTFQNGSAVSTDAIVGNSSSNRYPMYFEVIMEDTGEVLFKSGAMATGTKIKEIKLSKVLPSGQYNFICKFHILSEDKKTEKSAVSIRVVARVN